MEEKNEQTIKMVLPANCPHCAKNIVLTVELPTPSASVEKREAVEADVENLINKEKTDDITQDPTTV